MILYLQRIDSINKYHLRGILTFINKMKSSTKPLKIKLRGLKSYSSRMEINLEGKSSRKILNKDGANLVTPMAKSIQELGLMMKFMEMESISTKMAVGIKANSSVT